MDNLQNVLMSRMQSIPQRPSLADPSVPGRQQRYETGQAMQEAYRNDWNPNPILLRVLQDRQMPPTTPDLTPQPGEWRKMGTEPRIR